MSTKTALRRYIQQKNLQRSHSLHDCQILIDGDSFFKNSYKTSGCQFLLGPDCDRYTYYLRKQLKCFSKCNVKCYVIFKGATRDDLQKRLKIHEQIIDKRRLIEYSSYFEPLLVNDVQKQLLELLGIRYFCCEFESLEAIIGVARAFKCPVLTDNLEYCFYGVSCILPNSVTWEENNETVQCTMYDHDVYKASIGVHNKMPIFLTVLAMISELPQLGNIDDISSVIRWVKRQHKDIIENVANNIDDLNKRKVFLELYQINQVLYFYPSCNLAVKFFRRQKQYGLFKDDKRWFSKGVSDGRIAIPYVDIKRKGLVIGSTVIHDVQKPDAIEAAAPIITYAHCLLTNSQQSNLTYIGRKSTICTSWEFDKCWKRQICNGDIFTKYGKMMRKPSLGNPFVLFIKEILSERMASDLRFSVAPPSCKILILTLVYYVHNINKNFIDCTYCILLCYLILDPVLNKIRQGTSLSNDSDYNDCKLMYNKLKFLFKYDNVNIKYNRTILHTLAEFLHCLQHMNYLNNLCRQNFDDIPGTVYHKTYNATFVYNSFIFMKNKNNLMTYLESNFKGTWPLELFKLIVSEFDNYLQDLQNGLTKPREPKTLLEFFLRGSRIVT